MNTKCRFYKQIVFCWLCLFLSISLPISAQSELITFVSEYKEWISENYPHPEDLSVGELFYEAAKAIYFSQREPEVVRLLEYVDENLLKDEDQHDNGLRNYIGWIKARSNDSYLKYQAPALDVMAVGAKSYLGERDINYVRCQYFYLVSERYLRNVASAFDHLIRLQEELVIDNNSFENKELLCLLKFERANIEPFADNPSTYDGIFSAEMILDELYGTEPLNNSFSLEKALVYKAAGKAFDCISNYQEASESVNKIQNRDTQLVLDNNLVKNAALFYYDIAIGILQQIYPASHPMNVMTADECNNAWLTSSYEEVSNLELAKFIYDFYSYYLPDGSLEQDMGLLNLWLMEDALNYPVEDIFKLSLVEKNILQKATMSDEILISVYSQLLSLCAVYDQTSFQRMVVDLLHLVDERFGKNPLLKSFLTYNIFADFKDTDPSVYENCVMPSINEYLTNKDQSYLSIALGRSISLFLSDQILDKKKALQVQNKVCEDTKKVYGEDSPVYLQEELNRLLIQEFTDGEKTLGEFEHYINKIRHYGYNPIAWLNSYGQFLYYGGYDLERAREIYEELLNTCDTRVGDIIPVSIKAGYYFDYLNLLQDLHSDFDITEDIFNKAKSLMASETDSISINLYNYEKAALYLENTGRYNEALDMVDEGLRNNDILFNGILDPQSLSLHIQKVEILSELNNWSDAQRITNRLMSIIDNSNQTYLNINVLSGLIRLYRIRPYGNNTEFRINMLLKINDIANRLLAQIGEKTDFKLYYQCPITTEWLRIICDQGTSDIEESFIEFRDQYPDLYELNIDTIDFFREQRDEMDRLITSSFSLEDMDLNNYINPIIKNNLLDLIYSLSTYYYKVKKDPETALYYMSAYAEAIEDSPYQYASAICDLGFLNLELGNLEEAGGYFSKTLDLIRELPLLTPEVKLMFNIRMAPFYLENKDYSLALPLARERYVYVKEILDKNYYLLTHEAQNDIMERYGSPAVGYQALFKFMPEELASEMYDATLYATGLQLRSARNIREAALNANDQHLIELIDSIDSLRTQYKEIQANYANLSDLSHLTQRRRQYNEIQRLENEFIDKAKIYIENIGNDIDWQDIRNALHSDDMAIEYVFSGDRIMALILKQDCENPIAVNVCSSQDLYGLLPSGECTSDAKAKAIYSDKVVDLYKFLWEPLAPHFKEAANIYYTMPGPLSNFSLGVISDGNGEYLIDKYNLYQVTSTAELVRSRKMAPITSDTSALILGGVFYSPDQEEEYVGPEIFKSIILGETDIRALKKNRGLETDVFGYLPFTEFEVSEIECSISKLIDAKNLTNVSGFEANEASVRAMLNERPSIIHLATHGFFIPTDDEATQIPFYFNRYGLNSVGSMYRAGLALCGAEQTWKSEAQDRTDADARRDTEADKNDGILTAHEISQLDLRGVDLAVLSACESSLGNYSEEGVFGLPRGFKQAGVKSLIVSLWNVNDMSTALLMSDFYKNLANGQSYMIAWKNAINTVREKFPDPVYWGAFTMLDCLE